MERARLSSRVDAWAPWAAVLAITWPLVAYRYAAAYDLPFHEEIVAALRYHGDPARYPPGFFTWRLGMPNQLFYFLAWPLTYLVSVHVACTAVLGASVAGVPLAAARLADHLGRSRFAAVAVAPIAVGFLFNCGFVGNVLGLALFLALLPVLDRFAARPTPTGALQAALALLVLDFAHESSMTFGMLAVVVLTLGRRLTIRAVALRLFPLGVAFAALAIVHSLGNAMGGPELRWLPRVIFTPSFQKSEELPRMLLGRHDPDRMVTVAAVFEGVLALLAFDAIRTRSRVAPRRSGLLGVLAPHRFLLLGALLVAAYYVMPWEVDGATWINQRYLSPGVAVLAVALAPRAKPGPSWVTRLVAAVAVAMVVAVQLPAFATTSASLTELEALIPLVAPGSAIGTMELYSPAPRRYAFSIGGAVTRVTAARGGRATSSFLHDSPIPPLVIARRYRWDDLELRHQGMGLRPAYDLRELRYVIVWLRAAGIPDAPVTEALAPDARFVARSGGWVLYESTHDVIPIDSPELPAPAGAETLATRLAKGTRGSR